MGVEQVLGCAGKVLSEGRPCVLATVIAATGSTPAAPGFQMLVDADGRVAGTVGGGAVEHVVERSAMAVIAGAAEDGAASVAEHVAGLTAGVPRLEGAPAEAVRRFSLSPEKAGSVGMICGGDMDVLFTPLDEPSVRAAAAPGREGAWLAFPFDGGAPALAPDLPVEGSCGEAVLDDRAVFAVRLGAGGLVYIFGGGHVGQALVPVLARLDFPCVVVDDRPEFADPALFPDAVDVRCLPFDALEGELEVGLGDRICVMTRGHAGDADVLRFAFKTPARYIGAMGSSRKREAVVGSLVEEGFTEAPERLVLPIGLPLGGRTPAEIAISIAAQLIMDRCEG